MFKRVLIADDHSIVRLGMSIMLESNIKDVQIFVAENYFDVQKILKREIVDLLILDIHMPGVEKRVIKVIKAVYPSIKIFLFSAFTGDIVLQFIKDGADGYINKQCDSKEFFEAINKLYKGGIVIPADLTKQLIDCFDLIIPEKVLSERELEIFKLFTKGLGNLEITNLLNIKPGTVSTYKKRIFKKLKANSIADLIRLDMH